MTKFKYQIRKNEDFAACVSQYSVLCKGKIIYRTDDASEANRFVQQCLDEDRAFAMEG